MDALVEFEIWVKRKVRQYFFLRLGILKDSRIQILLLLAGTAGADRYINIYKSHTTPRL
jgi:hypothetical protein